MTVEEIQELIIDLLALEAGKASVDLRQELLALGAEMPVDSLLAVEVLVTVEERCGVSLPTTAENAANLCSVRTFARAIWDLIQVKSPAQAETA